MASYLTSSTLITSVKRRAMIPSSQNTFSDDDFLALANEEMQIGLVPSILQYHEEYMVYNEDVALTPSVSEYPIPYRAIGGKLRDLFYKDLQGNLFELTRISPEDIPYFQGGSTSTNLNAFYVRGNSIILLPAISSNVSGYLTFSYYLRPNELVKENRTATITGIDFNTGDMTVSIVPSNIIVGGLIDLLEIKPGHKTKSFDVAVTAVDATNKIISVASADLPSNLVVGDYLASSGECVIPQIPDELHSVLAQRVAARILEALGDTQGLTNANAKLQEMEIKTGNLIDNRVEGSPLKINNLRGTLRAGRHRRRF